VEKTRKFLEQSGAFDNDLRAIGKRLKATVALLEDADVAAKGRDALRGLLPKHGADIANAMMLIMVMGPRGKEDTHDDILARRLPDLKALAASLERGTVPRDREVRRVVASMYVQIGPLWLRLADLCRRLEALAHKQLRGVPFTKEEDHFLEEYGAHLGAVMLYGGNAWLTPRDDAPRVVDVFSNPNNGKVLEVGIARARALWVLYPWQGRDVLCRGAVMPYYEFTSPQRLTNAEWKAVLDSPNRPAPPAWLKPLLGDAGISQPEFQKSH
jgi:hypothetical protein